MPGITRRRESTGKLSVNKALDGSLCHTLVTAIVYSNRMLRSEKSKENTEIEQNNRQISSWLMHQIKLEIAQLVDASEIRDFASNNKKFTIGQKTPG